MWQKVKAPATGSDPLPSNHLDVVVHVQVHISLLRLINSGFGEGGISWFSGEKVVEGDIAFESPDMQN